MKRTLFLLFFVHLLTRLLYINISGVFNNYDLQCDSHWLVNLADQCIHGNFNFDIGRFIASPLFPFLCGTFKLLFHSHWSFYLIFFQVVLSSVSGLYIFKIAFLIFKDSRIALFASLMFALFPMTIWFVHTFSQESLFQSLLIFSVYHLLAALHSNKKSDTLKAAVFFSLTYLTKSHILILSLFIPLVYIHRYGINLKSLTHIFIFTFIAFLFSLPYGLYQYKKNGAYVISSNGAGYQFYLGNTEAGYKTLVDVPDENSDEFQKIQDITVTAGSINRTPLMYDVMMRHPQNIKQKEFYSEALKWISLHPLKFIKLKLYDILFFLIPGVSFRHYSFLEWISTFLICMPVYLFAYFAIFKKCNGDFKNNSWIFYLFLSMFIFSTVWYVQNRFRTITLEPFYVVYASASMYKLVCRFSFGQRVINFLDVLFLKYLQSLQLKKMFMF